MKNLSSVLFVSLLLFTTPPAKADPTPPLASISGSNFLIIQIAIPEVKKNKFDISKYKISVEDRDKSYRVLFSDPHSPHDTVTTDGHLTRLTVWRGSSPNMQEFEVEIDKSTRKVIGLYYER